MTHATYRPESREIPIGVDGLGRTVTAWRYRCVCACGWATTLYVRRSEAWESLEWHQMVWSKLGPDGVTVYYG